MSIKSILLAMALCSFSTAAAAQEIVKPPFGSKGLYSVGIRTADVGTPTAMVCLKRVDRAPAEFLTVVRDDGQAGFPSGCVPAIQGETFRATVAVAVTPNDDAEIRAFAYDGVDLSLANESLPSDQWFRAIFTPPGKIQMEP